MSSDANVVYALDFDGVICDSVGESSEAAVRAALQLWPGLPFDLDENGRPAKWTLDAMRAVRSVVETGYENLLLVRLISAVTPDTVQDHFVDQVLSDWPTIREWCMKNFKTDKEKMVQAFGDTRDSWIGEDTHAWVAANQMFPGVVDALNFASAPLYIITTKQTRFCTLLLREYGVMNVPEDRVFGYGTGSKISVLKKIIAMPENKGKNVCFVEDRYETLEAVSLSMLGQPLQLYLATWGYNTEQTRKTAEKHPFINLIDLPTFISKLQ